MMDRSRIKVTTLHAADEATCLSLSVDERLAVLERLNRLGRVALGYPADVRLDRKQVRISYRPAKRI